MENYWNHNTAFHRELVARIASTGGRVLDVGCGDGLLLQRVIGRLRHESGDIGVVTAQPKESLSTSTPSAPK